MKWPKVIISAVVLGVYCGLIKVVPFLKNTSFQDIDIMFEWWWLFAIILIVNCDKWYEASLKTFVFFLISQPLIYLVQVPFYRGGWQIFMYYKYWFIITLLTLPGAAVGFLLKKKNWLSALVLAVPVAYMGWGFIYYFHSCTIHFPYHLLSSLSCLGMAGLFDYALLDDKKQKIFEAAVFVIVAAASIVYYFVIPHEYVVYSVR